MNKKRLAKGLTAAALIGVIAVGSTLAYLSANTGQKTNKFSGANISGSTEENFNPEEAANYVPGQKIQKEPWISIKAGSAKAKVAMVVDYIGDDETTKLSQDEFKRYAEVSGWNLGENEGQWKLVKASQDGKSEMYIYNSVVDASESKTDIATEHLFENVIANSKLRTVTDKDNTIAVYKDAQKTEKVEFENITNSIVKDYFYDQNGNILVKDSLPKFTIDLSGYAVQSEHLDGTSAVNELIKLANEGREGAQQFELDTLPSE
ncbi:hypothetical protein [Eubacterium maltosivorans]|uniref:hypothetical protein n=1 Tax=Eubacterium maltosivorans TaxID=2041044 RepID=UPI00189C915B|nr:hypothetical protein [Eubacterium maltosivorans]